MNKPGRRRSPTQADIARRLGVTAAAVGLALNGRPGVSDELRQKVGRVADELGYRPNYAARTMRLDRSHIIGVIYRNLHNPAFLRLIEGFDETCNARGYTVMIGSSRFDRTREINLIESFAGRGVDGLAVMAVHEEGARNAWQRFGDKPMALLASPETISGPRVFSVRSDTTQPIVQAVEHLVGLGHRRIALMTGTHDRTSGALREQTFVELARSHGVEPTMLSAGWDQAMVERTVAGYLAQEGHATAIIANSDRVAMAVYLAAKNAGLRIPDDLSVIGHDDIDTAALLAPPLTTFRVDLYQMGVSAAQQLMELVEGGHVTQGDVVFPVDLIVRDSTARPPA